MKHIKNLVLSISLLIPMVLSAQNSSITVSGSIKDNKSQSALSYVSVVLKTETDSAFVSGTITNDEGLFVLSGVKPGKYVLEASYVGFKPLKQPLFVGSLSKFLEVAPITLEEDIETLSEVVVTGLQDAVSESLDKKTFTVADNVSQAGGSVLQAMQNLPGVTVQDGKVLLRGNDRVAVLIDGKQTALTGFGSQSGLDNLPASAIEKIEIINNPSSKYDANGNAGIINIIYKKDKQEGFNGKVGVSSGLGALWVKNENLPTIRPQYQATPKINPSLSLNYKKNKVNTFLQADNLYTHTLNKNEFVTRTYDDGTVIYNQTKRNRDTNLFSGKTGMDWAIDDANSLTISGFFSSEKILDRGDEPFFEGDLSNRYRLWQFLEDELKTTVMATAAYQHKYKQPGRMLNIGFNYTYHRENEQYFFDNILPESTGRDAFKLISDEHVADFNLDYVQPLQYGRFETGLKFRRRTIPTNMQFFPGLNSPIDSAAGGWANYGELIPAVYGNYVFENEKYEVEAGVRVEYVKIDYKVNPDHPTYKTSGYNYTQPFPNVRLAYKLNENNKLSVFFNRRVDRPNEVDIRIFPKYDDAEVIKVGNPGLRPQFTTNYELGHKGSWNTGYLYSSVYHKQMDATITRIGSIVPGSVLIYNIFQNAGKSYNTGFEILLSQSLDKWATVNFSVNGYQNIIEAFTVTNLYPEVNVFTAARQEILSGNVKLNSVFHLAKQLDIQLSGTYLAPDIIPQGTIGTRFSLDLGIKKSMQQGRGELYANATDLLNTMRVKREIQGDGFKYVATDYYETQVVRVGYSYKF
jgi:outer membrane receptor protein involved in Fe transport